MYMIMMVILISSILIIIHIIIITITIIITNIIVFVVISAMLMIIVVISVVIIVVIITIIKHHSSMYTLYIYYISVRMILDMLTNIYYINHTVPSIYQRILARCLFAPNAPGTQLNKLVRMFIDSDIP